MVSTLDSGSSGPGSSLCSLSGERHFTPTVLISKCINGFNIVHRTFSPPPRLGKGLRNEV